MMADPTPGPWKAHRRQAQYQIKSDLPGRDESRQILVSVVVENEAGPAVTRANAQQIAAVPLLRLAAQQAVDVLMQGWDDSEQRLAAIGALAYALGSAARVDLEEVPG